MAVTKKTAAKRPAKKTAKPQTLDELMAMATRYHVDSNALFRAAAEQYETQQRVIRRIRDAIDAEELTTEKQYVKDAQPGIYASPLSRELPTHADSANKTLGMMLDIINKLGREEPPEDDLQEFLDE